MHNNRDFSEDLLCCVSVGLSLYLVFVPLFIELILTMFLGHNTILINSFSNNTMSREIKVRYWKDLTETHVNRLSKYRIPKQTPKPSTRSKIQIVKSHDYSTSRQRNEDLTSQTRNNKHVQRIITFLLLKRSCYL